MNGSFSKYFGGGKRPENKEVSPKLYCFAKAVVQPPMKVSTVTTPGSPSSCTAKRGRSLAMSDERLGNMDDHWFLYGEE